MAAIAQPTRRSPEAQEKKKDPLASLLQGLQIAANITGVYADISRIGEAGEVATQRKDAADRDKVQFKIELGKYAEPTDAANPDFTYQGQAYALKKSEPANDWKLTGDKNKAGQALAYSPSRNILAPAKGDVPFQLPETGAAVAETPAQKKVDQIFANEVVDFKLKGGFADIKKQLDQLRFVQERLGKTDTASGWFIGNVPDRIRSSFFSEGMDMQEMVEEVVQRNLRIVLGAQFTQKEGERLIARAYNSKMDEATNARRLGRLVTQIEDAAKAKVEAVEYYEKNGTLAGFTGEVYDNFAQFNDNLPSDLQANDGVAYADETRPADVPGGKPLDTLTEEEILSMSPEEIDIYLKNQR